MNVFALFMAVLIPVFLLSAAVPGAIAAEEVTAETAQVQAEEAHDSSVAIGYVYVTLLEWEPDLEGIGSGLFTHSEFDFTEFFEKVFEPLAGLLA